MAMPKMSKRVRSMAIGIMCGLCCAGCVGAYVFQIDEQAHAAQTEMLSRYGGEQVEVCVAKRDIVAGDRISEGDIEVRTWIATMLPMNSVTDRKEAVGKQVGSTIFAGEVISTSRFGFESADIDVPSGFVAVSVPTREVQAVGGALESGMTTDVFAVGPTSTTKLASSVSVLATSMHTDGSSNAAAWITLAVKPSAVEELISAAENLDLYFALPAEDASAEAGDPEREDRRSERTKNEDTGEEGR